MFKAVRGIPSLWGGTVTAAIKTSKNKARAHFCGAGKTPVLEFTKVGSDVDHYEFEIFGHTKKLKQDDPNAAQLGPFYEPRGNNDIVQCASVSVD